MTMAAANLLASEARRLAESGLSVLPAKLAEKRPAVHGWKRYQTVPGTPDQVSQWCDNAGVDAVCIVCGNVSGGVEMIDFDQQAVAYGGWAEMIPGDLLERLVVERSQSGGKHVVYRHEGEPVGNRKLAERVDSETGEIQTVIETRGEGGLFLCSPSPGYELEQGDLADLPVLTADERETLIRSAMSLTTAPQKPVGTRTASGDTNTRPGDDFNARGDIRPILRQRGWTLIRPGENEQWRRPGKSKGSLSATLRDGVFYVFSSNAAPFEPGTAYAPFAVYAMLTHDGDFERAARFLRAKGYGGEQATGSAEVTEWPEPLPMQSDLPPVVAFDPDLLPATLRGFVMDTAERMQCPPDFPAVAAMVALGSVLGRKVAIRPKQKDDWTEYANLWGVLIGRPSLMKSPPMKEMLGPIRRLSDVAYGRYRKEVEKYEGDIEIHSLKRKTLKASIEKSMRAGKDARALEQNLKKLAPPREPQRRRYTINDVTVEALGEVLKANPNGLLLERDELMGWLKSLERLGQEGSRAFFLEAWGGKGEHETDRIGRGNVRIDQICLSIIGTIQPGPLGQYLSEALHGGTGDDGLIQRFQMAVWPDCPDTFQVVDRIPDKAARQTAHDVFQAFDDLKPGEIGERPDILDVAATPFLRYEINAQYRFYQWMQERENAARGAAEHPAVESHLTKYRKLVPALSLLIHLAEANTGPVSLDALDRAIRWGRYLESHARRIYAQGVEPAGQHARALVQRIKSGDVGDGFTLRDVYHGKHWSMLSTADEVKLAVRELLDLGWLRVEREATRGKPKEVHRINPKAMALLEAA